jgi:hypothetical protein
MNEFICCTATFQNVAQPHCCGTTTFAVKKLFYAQQQGCQIVLGTTYQNGKNVPNDHKIYPNGRKIGQRAITT